MPAMPPVPDTMVTIAMPAYNEEHYIETCIASVQAQDYPRELIEILVADGRSTDKTRDILARMGMADPRIRIIDNPDRLQAAGLGKIIKAAAGDVIVRMDVHCEYAPDYVRKCVETLAETGAENVGGAQRAKAKTLFQRALCAALTSPLGVGGARYRSADAEGFVDTVFLGAFRPPRVRDRRHVGSQGDHERRHRAQSADPSNPAARSSCPRTSSFTTTRAIRCRRSRSSTSSTVAAARARCSSSVASRTSDPRSRSSWSPAARR